MTIMCTKKQDILPGSLTEDIDLASCSDCVALNIPIGQWHTVEVLESGTVILECKDGGYEPLGEEDILDYKVGGKKSIGKKEGDLVARLREVIENEGRSCSMDLGGITPEFVYRMWGGTVLLAEIMEAFAELQL